MSLEWVTDRHYMVRTGGIHITHTYHIDTTNILFVVAQSPILHSWYSEHQKWEYKRWWQQSIGWPILDVVVNWDALDWSDVGKSIWQHWTAWRRYNTLMHIAVRKQFYWKSVLKSVSDTPHKPERRVDKQKRYSVGKFEHVHDTFKINT